jgi:hypothetical protein
MKIIEGLKKTKDLQRKASDIRAKLSKHCADLDANVPEYETEADQREQISKWLQSHSDILKEIETLRLRIQHTNLTTVVKVEVVDDKYVEKTIAAWIHRRKDLAKLEAEAWRCLTNRSLQPRNFSPDPKNPENIQVANVRKYYNQVERDTNVENFTSEPSRIDGALEIANAITDLVEL